MKKYLFSIVTVIVWLIVFLPACKKETTDPPATESRIGRYVVSSPGFSYKYMEVSDDTVYFFSESGYYNIRSKTSYAYTFSSDTMFIFGQPYKFSIQDGTFTLSGTPYYHQTIVAERSNSVPSANTWVIKSGFTFLGAVPGSSSDRFYDMTSYNGNVVSDGFNNNPGYVFKNIAVDHSSYTFTTTDIPVDPSYISEVGYEDNIEYYNNKFLVYEWGNPNSSFYRINPGSGVVENVIPVTNPVGNVYALASDGTSLYGMTYTGIRKFDFVNNAWESEAVTGGAGAMAGRNGFIYFSTGSSNIIQKYNTTTTKVEGAFEIPDNYSIYGLAFESDYALVACLYNYTSGTYGVYLIYL